MNQAQKHELNILIDAAGRQLSAAATALDKAQESNGGKQPTHGLIVAATQEFAKCDAANVAIQRFNDAQPVDGVPVIPPAPPPEPEAQFPGTGPYPAGGYSKEDATFVYWFAFNVYAAATGRQDLWRDAFSGSHLQMSQFINAGFPGVYVPPDSGAAYAGRYRAPCEAALAKYKK